MIGVWNNIARIKRELEKRGIPHDNIIKKHQGGNDISWKCEITRDGKYKVSALRYILEDNGQVDIDNFIWIKEIPLKVSCFIWRAKRSRISTMTTPSSRGINLPTTTCCQCNSMEETTDHIPVQCVFAKSVTEWIFNWCNVPLISFQTVHDVLDYASNWGTCPKKKKRLLSICYTILWSIWKVRNK
ncbi:unnamed protein product [Lactuca saligna]|uniref:Reverse transcriptase zinc-binding domain-containing protein n=1 Tax=Lactuca saligna TaxID=75948 RepID=A0AA35YYW1_LACSI|nr:unnamed protein product [Lactuca saligna]